MTAEKAKDVMMGVKAKLIDLTQQYKLLGMEMVSLQKTKTTILMVHVMSLKVQI